MFKTKCICCNGEPTGSRDYPLNRNRGRKKLHGTEGVKSDRGTEAACRIRACALPIPPRDGGKSSRERGVMWSIPSGFSVSETDWLYADLWSRSGNSEVTTPCQGAAAAMPGVPALHVEKSCVGRQGYVVAFLRPCAPLQAQCLKWSFPWVLPSSRILLITYLFILKKGIILFWEKPLRSYINHMKYKYIFSPIA